MGDFLIEIIPGLIIGGLIFLLIAAGVVAFLALEDFLEKKKKEDEDS